MRNRRYWSGIAIAALAMSWFPGGPAAAATVSPSIRVGLSQGVSSTTLSASLDSQLAVQGDDGKLTALGTVHRMEPWQVSMVSGRQFSVVNPQGKGVGNARGRLLL